MDGNETEKRIYIGDCGCVRVESKHFRMTLQPENFVELLREIVSKRNSVSSFYSRLSISNNISDSAGFATFQNKRRKNK
jgi:hypothetical protein